MSAIDDGGMISGCKFCIEKDNERDELRAKVKHLETAFGVTTVDLVAAQNEVERLRAELVKVCEPCKRMEAELAALKKEAVPIALMQRLETDKNTEETERRRLAKNLTAIRKEIEDAPEMHCREETWSDGTHALWAADECEYFARATHRAKLVRIEKI